MTILRMELKSRLYTTSKEICSFIESTFTVRYIQEGVVKLLHRIGFSYKQTKQIPCECNIGKQEQFVKELMELVGQVKASENKAKALSFQYRYKQTKL
jgi:transposase